MQTSADSRHWKALLFSERADIFVLLPYRRSHLRISLGVLKNHFRFTKSWKLATSTCWRIIWKRQITQQQRLSKLHCRHHECEMSRDVSHWSHHCQTLTGSPRQWRYCHKYLPAWLSIGLQYWLALPDVIAVRPYKRECLIFVCLQLMSLSSFLCFVCV